MDSSVSLSLETLTCLEYENFSKLKNDIIKIIFKDSQSFPEEELDIMIYGEIKKRNNIRIRHENGVGGKKEKYTEALSVVSPGMKIDLIFSDYFFTELFAENIYSFVSGLSEKKIRIGNNITLGKGICKCTGIQGFDRFQKYDLSKLILKIINFGAEECSHVIVKAHSEEGILIRDENSGKNTYYVYENVSDDSGMAVIPASTWKGIFRHRVREWIRFAGESPHILDELFGNKEKDIKGKLVFFDSVIYDKKEIFSRRMHMDKFSGTQFSDGLFTNRYLSGSFELRIEYTGEEIDYKPFIIAVLNDFQNKRVNIGADIGTGKGFIEIDDVKFFDRNSFSAVYSEK